MREWIEADPLLGLAWKWSASRAAQRYAAGVLVTLGVLTAVSQIASGRLLLRQLPAQAQALAQLTFGVSAFFTALSPVVVLLAFSALLCAASYLFDVGCDLRQVAILGGIAHLPVALWSTASAVILVFWPPEVNVQHVLQHKEALDLTWQFNIIASARPVAYFWTLVLFTVVWSRTWTSRTWRPIVAVAVATMACWAVVSGLSQVFGRT